MHIYKNALFPGVGSIPVWYLQLVLLKFIIIVTNGEYDEFCTGIYHLIDLALML